MGVIFREINTECADYQFVETLLHSAFPADERRDDHEQRRNVDRNEKMKCLLIKDGDTNIGFITLWTLCDIFYVEHFAIDVEFRRHGYGTKALETLTRLPNVSKLILEVELPTTEESVKRIKFYEKCGLKLSSRPYVQPPYSPEKESVTMALMTYGDVDEEMVEKAVEEMYKLVYGYYVKS